MSDPDRFVRFCERDFGQAVMNREAEYLEQFINPDDRILDDYLDAHREYFLGISGDSVFESNDPAQAAVLSVYGSPGINHRPHPISR